MDDKLNDYVLSLQTMLNTEMLALEELQAQVKPIEYRIKRVRAAIKALEGGEAKTAPTKKATTAPTTWNVSAEKVAIVQAAVDAHPDGATITELANHCGVANDTVRKAIYILREQELVRQAGKRQRADGRGYAPTIYKPMPNGELVNAF